MAARVAGRLDHPASQGADRGKVAFDQLGVEKRDALDVLGRSPDPDLGKTRLHFGRALNVIGVMMGDEEVGQLPSLPGRRRDHRRAVRRIDRRRRAGGRIMNEHAVIVGEAEKLKQACHRGDRDR